MPSAYRPPLAAGLGISKAQGNEMSVELTLDVILVCLHPAQRLDALQLLRAKVHRI
jgi:hypothetical protein